MPRIRHLDLPLQSAPAIGFAILIVPLFDTLRVVGLRILNRRSPFSPDRNHIHHFLLDLGLSHQDDHDLPVLLLISIYWTCLFFAGIRYRYCDSCAFRRCYFSGECHLLQQSQSKNSQLRSIWQKEDYS